VLVLDISDFDEVRKVQQERISTIQSSGECWLICEHSSVITLGKRTKEEELNRARLVAEKFQVPIRDVSRGGGVSVHLPGMLMLYPVVDLRGRGLGVKKFIESVFNCFSATVADTCGVSAADYRVSLSKPGLWTVSSNKKLASVGLRIERGISNHGFAFNLSNSSELIEALNPCGVGSEEYGTFSKELGLDASARELLFDRISGSLRTKLPLI